MARIDLATKSSVDAQAVTLADHETRIDALEAAPPGGGGGSATVAGVVQLDSFTGTTYDAKLTNAMTYAAAQTYKPYIQFPAQSITLSQGGRVPYSDMKLLAPGWAPGFKNLELGTGHSNHRVLFGSGVGTGAASWFHSTGTVYNVYVGGLAFQGAIGAANARLSQFWSQPSGTLYSCVFDSLNFYGMKHVMGNPTQNCALTWVHFIGPWTVNGFIGTDTQFHIGGSDGDLWMAGGLNIEGAAGNGAFMLDFDNLQKMRIGKIFATSKEGWRSARFRGSTSKGVGVFGFVAEGRNAGNPCHGCLIRVEAGNWNFYAPWTAFGMANPTAFGGGNNGIFEVTGSTADVSVWGGDYERATGVAETVPLYYVSAGKLDIRGQKKMGTWTGLPRADAAGGTITADGTVTVI